ncbi:hypothetical protein KSP40_PGU013157 [Platanthera guangdongensis]|uniref:Uncharacterized protein n=1 Tax=Platanthera guangdongensis TaxID=2320717 RepID=A0ABR2N355_9ASPA
MKLVMDMTVDMAMLALQVSSSIENITLIIIQSSVLSIEMSHQNGMMQKNDLLVGGQCGQMF